MRKVLLSAALLLGLTSQTFAEVNINADVVSRYLWRGQQQPGGMAVQPSINYSTNSVEIGTWVSQSMNGDHSETNIYIGLSAGPVNLMITDYTDAFNDLFSVGDHLIEVMASYEHGDLSAAIALDVLNGDNDLWVELGYSMGKVGDADIGFSFGLGNKKYTSDLGDPMVALLGVNASQGSYFASYQINPEAKGNMVFIGKSF